jgi:hypothetical protein
VTAICNGHKRKYLQKELDKPNDLGDNNTHERS